MIQIEVIYQKTGSSGNCTILTDGQTKLMIDCGIAPKKINKENISNLTDIQGCLITHHHIDHAKYIDDVCFNRCIPTYMSLQTQETLKAYNYYDKTIKSLNSFKIGTMNIVPFELPHINCDRSICHNFGYLIGSTITKDRLLFATDCSNIDIEIPPCEYYFIECNYEQHEMDYIELDNIIVDVELRRMDSHLSLQKCINFLKNQDLSKCKYIKLIHTSKADGNKDEYFREKVQKEFKVEVLI